MSILLLLVFISMLFLALSVYGFIYSIGMGDHDHADRLALLPMEHDVQKSVKKQA